MRFGKPGSTITRIASALAFATFMLATAPAAIAADEAGVTTATPMGCMDAASEKIRAARGDAEGFVFDEATMASDDQVTFTGTGSYSSLAGKMVFSYRCAYNPKGTSEVTLTDTLAKQ